VRIRFKYVGLLISTALTALAIICKIDGAATVGMGAIVAAVLGNTADNYSKSKYYRNELDGK
jgi:hypothetical protein